jgi:DNA invertase Pin-like site-specific DNA recombinase
MIYGYLRVSSDEQDVNNQKQGVMELALKNDWLIEDWISDEGVSGTKDPDKRQLGVLMKRCQRGDIIICSELSRLGRKMLMVMSILEFCMKNGIMIYTVKDNYVLGDNIQSTVLAFAFSLASQIERDMIAMRTKEALVLKRKQGVLLGTPRGGGRAPYVSDEQVKKMTDMLNAGSSLVKIAEVMKIHRLTVGYHLTRLGIYKGHLMGFKIKYFNGNEITLTKRNCMEYGLYYQHIKSAILSKKDLSTIGIESAEPVYGEVSAEIKDLYNKAEHPLLNNDEIKEFVLSGLTIPEIHAMVQDKVDYDTVYEYIQADTDLSLFYRERGHKRVLTVKRR